MSGSRRTQSQPATRNKNQNRWNSKSNPTEMYVDSARATANFYTIILEFGLAQDDGTLGELMTRIRMSPQHAKVLLALLSETIVNYETASKYTIQVPEEIRSLFGEQDVLPSEQASDRGGSEGHDDGDEG